MKIAKWVSVAAVGVALAACGHNTRSTLPSVYFASGSAKIDEKGGKLLDDVAAAAKKRGYLNSEIYLSGYADSAGDKAANERLAKARVEAVRKALIERGVMEDRIDVRSHGERHQHVKTAEGKAEEENRRVEIRMMAPVTWEN
jgi:OOP family OmpA-OmpF porin